MELEKLKTLLHYDSKSGDFIWKTSVNDRIKIGDKAGSLYNNGYVNISIGGKRYKAHRLAFLYMTGKFPTGQIDHVNKDRSDNRWSNLREVSHVENQRNREDSADCLGVCFDFAKKKWRAYTDRYNGKAKFLGNFDFWWQAVLVRKNWEALNYE